MSLPSSVPILLPCHIGDSVTDPWGQNRTSGLLCSWRADVFEGATPSEYRRMTDIVDAEINKEGLSVYSYCYTDEEQAASAAAWNRAMARLGYVVGNPQARTIRKREERAAKRKAAKASTRRAVKGDSQHAANPL